jgi:hypothetical protein
LRTTNPPNEVPKTIGRSIPRTSQRVQVVGPLVEVPPFRCPGLAAAVPPVVVVHDLGDLSQRRITRLEGCVVESRAAVHDDDRRPLPHGHSVRYELGTVDVDEEPHVTDGNEHDESRLTG